ncbi:MAG: ATP-binding cassette domain-containing protein [Acidimicrobiales bacterium]
MFGAPNALGGLGTKLIEDVVGLADRWDLIIGALILFAILIVHPDGVAAVATANRRPWNGSGSSPPRPRRTLPVVDFEPSAGSTLEIRDLTVTFGPVTAVDAVSLEVRPGEVVGLIGPNGAGKTTLIDAVTGFVPVAGGTISLDGDRIDRYNATHRAPPGPPAIVPVARAVRGHQRGGQPPRCADLRAPFVAHRPVLAGRHELPPSAVVAVQEFGLEPDLDLRPDQLVRGGAASSGSRGRSRRAPTSCCSTSRPRASTSTRAPSLPTSSAGWPTNAGWGCCSSSTMSGWSCRRAIAWW